MSKKPGIRIAPSLMCSDFRHLEYEINLFEENGVDFLHIDVMDGHFVPNITLGPPVVRAISAMTRLPLDVHMMVAHPESFIPVMMPPNNPIVTVHAETATDVERRAVGHTSRRRAAGRGD